jgi:hypothetical protein
MKRALVATILGLAASEASLYADGQVVFSNYASVQNNPISYGTGVIGEAAGTLVNDPTVEVQLYYAIGTYTSTSSFLAAATAGNTTFVDPSLLGDGYYYDAADLPDPSGHYGAFTPIVQTIAGWTGQVGGVYTYGSNPVTFMVRAWETAGPQGNATYGQALVSGQSSLWTETAADTTYNAIGVDLLGSTEPEFGNGPIAFSISAVPEPATITLVGLVAVQIIFSYRRKSCRQ